MARIGLFLAIIALVPLIISCAAPQEGVQGTGKGTGSIVEGATTGVAGLSKGTGTAVSGTVQATTATLAGKGDEAISQGKAAIKGGGEAIRDIVVEPVKGLEKGLKEIDEGIKKSTGTKTETKPVK